MHGHACIRAFINCVWLHVWAGPSSSLRFCEYVCSCLAISVCVCRSTSMGLYVLLYLTDCMRVCSCVYMHRRVQGCALVCLCVFVLAGACLYLLRRTKHVKQYKDTLPATEINTGSQVVQITTFAIYIQPMTHNHLGQNWSYRDSKSIDVGDDLRAAVDHFNFSCIGTIVITLVADHILLITPPSFFTFLRTGRNKG